MPSTSLVLTTDQRADLETRVRSGRGRADAARRARVILLLAEGCRYAAIATRTGCSSRTIALWKQRFATDGLAGLAARHRGSKPTVLTPALEARIMTWTRRPPPHGATHWSTRSLGRKLGVQHTRNEGRDSEAFSFQVATDNQEETDRYWNAIVGNGGEERTCGWCKDGASWPIH